MNVLIIALIVFSLILAFGVGGQDETMATLYGSGSLTLRKAVIIGAILSFFGVLFLSQSVGETIGENLLGEKVNYTIYMMLAILISTSFWLIIASKTHAPISTTHSIIGALIGVAFVWSIAEEQPFNYSMN